MALPGSGALSIAQIETEFSLPAGSLWPDAFWGKGGAPASGALVLPNDFWGRSAAPVYPNAPTLFDAGTVQSGINTLSLTWPAGHATNDCAIIVVQTNNQAMPSTPTGCTVLGTGAGAGTAGGVGGVRLYVYYIRATSGAMPAITIPDSGNVTSAAMSVFRGVVTTGVPIEGSVLFRVTTATTAVSMLNSTYLYGKNRTLFACFAHNRDLNSSANVSGWANTDTGGLTEVYDSSTNSSNGGGIAAAYGTLNSQTQIGTTTATLATSQLFEYMHMALIPAGIPASGITPDYGSYSNNGGLGTATYTLTSGIGPVTWNWSATASIGLTSTVANGGSGSSITFNLAQGTADRSTVITVTVGNYTWKIQLDNTGSGGGCMAMTMTL